MAFVKVLKNKAYFKRYQVKYRRRRDGKTDYAARRKLVLQDANKYNAHKYRFVVRSTNQRILCQIVYSTVQGDVVLCSADSMELKKFGIPVGFNNYAAAYATGLLCARRVLKKMGLNDMFKGVNEATGEDYHVEEEMDERRPFKCLLDIGIINTTVGNRVFGAMKGACDGGIHIPHSNKRFPGYTKEEGGDGNSGNYDASVHRSRIFGLHVAEYMKSMKEEDPEKYNAHFSQYIKNKISADNIEQMYKNAHQQIRKNPDSTKKERPSKVEHSRSGHTIKTHKSSYVRNVKISCEERKARVAKKLEMVALKMQE